MQLMMLSGWLTAMSRQFPCFRPFPGRREQPLLLSPRPKKKQNSRAQRCAWSAQEDIATPPSGELRPVTEEVGALAVRIVQPKSPMALQMLQNGRPDWRSINRRPMSRPLYPRQ